MRHVVLGASGQVGGHLFRYLREQGEQVVGTYHGRPDPELEPFDLCDPNAGQSIHRWRPDWVWIPAAMPDVDRCEREPEQSWRVNVEGPERVARSALEAGARVVYFSSDYVFPGERGPYRESDPTSPVQVYGAHKAKAERRLLALAGPVLVVRTAWIYSQEAHPRNFVFRIVQALRRGEVVRAAIDQWNTPTDAQALARAAYAAAQAGLVGVVHLAGPRRMTRYQFTREVAEAAGFDPDQIVPVELGALNLPARRPLDGGLISERWTLPVE